MKTLKIITGALSAISALIMIAIPFLSSYMQGFYKSQIDDFSKSAQELLDKKQFWAQIGESYLFLYIFIACVSLFVIVIFIDWLKARKSK
ncbi:MAG: hypothetical protein IKU82_06445 [Clostridia bacterium]|nr:hypothetical protein [Clostridia bacterium]